jgi:hypothetical protein
LLLIDLTAANPTHALKAVAKVASKRTPAFFFIAVPSYTRIIYPF